MERGKIYNLQEKAFHLFLDYEIIITAWCLLGATLIDDIQAGQSSEKKVRRGKKEESLEQCRVYVQRVHAGEPGFAGRRGRGADALCSCAWSIRIQER